MELLIPAAWRKAKAEGRAERRAEERAQGYAEGYAQGYAEGRAKGRAEEQARVQSIIAQFGKVDPDTGVLTLGIEAQERLRNGSGKR